MRFKKTKIYYALALITSTTMLASPVGLAGASENLNLNLNPNSSPIAKIVDQFKASVPLSNLAGDVLTSGNSLSANQQLNTNDYLTSTNGTYRLYLQGDGNLVLFEIATNVVLWAAGTQNSGATLVNFQGDGNFVMRNASGGSVWSTGTDGVNADRLVVNDNGSVVIYAGDSVIWSQGNPPPADTGVGNDEPTGNGFLFNETLSAYNFIASQNDIYRLYMQSDGNLVLRDTATESAIWSSGTGGSGASYVIFQDDGNFILRTAAGAVVWKTDTENDNAETIVLHDNGALAMYSSATVVWSVGNPPPDFDATPPMITLAGSAQMTLNTGDSFTDPGATATDNVDGNVSNNIMVSGNVDTNTVGNYTISYDVSDSSGNAATTIYRTVSVQNAATGDAPTSTNSLSGDQNLFTNEELTSNNGAYKLFMQGDGNLVLRDTATMGALWSSGTDGSGAEKIHFQGDGNLVMRHSNGAAIWSTNSAGSGGNLFILNNNGSLVIYAGNAVVWSVGNSVPTGDSIAPVITLNGSSTVDINQFDVYNDTSATANDNIDGDISSNITVSGSVNANVLGTYTLNYNVSDNAGNAANTVTRTVNVLDGGGVDTVAPVIALLGNTVVNINVGGSYFDAGATANDNVDGNISNAISTGGSVDVSTPGSYTLTFNVTDAAGNAATQMSRTVNVLDDSGTSGNGGFVTTGNGRFSAPSNALYALNDSVTKVASRDIDSRFNGNGHAQSWDGRLFVRKTTGGWFAEAFRPERVVRNADGTPNFNGAFDGKELLMATDTSQSGRWVHDNWLAMIPDPDQTGDNPYRSDANGNPAANGTHDTYKTVVYHTAREYSSGGALQRKDNIGFRKATFVIANAKTTNASAVRADFTSTFAYIEMTNGNNMYCIEPSVTNDGRLIICQGDARQDGKIDRLIYSYNQNPAVVNGWSVARNVTSMYYADRNVDVAGMPFYQRYPVAEFPMKEASGRTLGNGEVIRGAYPWISRDGSELFYQHTKFLDLGKSDPAKRSIARRTGASVVGRWTGGILRHIDGSLNKNRHINSRLFLSSTGAFTTMWSAFKDFENPVLPYSIRGAGYGIFHSNGQRYTEVSFEDFLDGNYIMFLGMNEQLPVDNSDQAHMINNTPDTSGRFNNGILVGAQFPKEFDGVDDIDGFNGQAIHFNNNDYVSINKNSGWDELNDGFTAELWVQKFNGSGTMRLFTLDGGIELYLSNGTTLGAAITDTSGNRISVSGANIANNQWKHVAVVYDKANGLLRLYDNGNEVDSASTSSFGTLNVAGSVNVGLSNSSGHVLIDEVRVSNLARAPFEVAYAANKASNVQPNSALQAKIPAHLSSLSRHTTGVTNFSDTAADLGEALFNDEILSLNNGTSCATCHNPAQGFSDSAALAQGNEPTDEGTRNAGSLINRLFSSFQGWGGVAPSLEAQAIVPITAAHEMNLSANDAVARLGADSTYVTWFQNAYGQQPNVTNLTQALAAFQATQFSPKVAFDNYKEGNESALTAQQIRGLKLFEGKARCSGCHAGDNFTDESFRNTGLIDNGDNGRGGQTGRERDHNLFKVPTLRQADITAPYMHDGSMATLEEVVDKYNEGPFIGDMIDTDIRPLLLSSSEKADLVAFLKTL